MLVRISRAMCLYYVPVYRVMRLYRTSVLHCMNRIKCPLSFVAPTFVNDEKT
jgi:hypothetical protein